MVLRSPYQDIAIEASATPVPMIRWTERRPTRYVATLVRAPLQQTDPGTTTPGTFTSTTTAVVMSPTCAAGEFSTTTSGGDA